LSELGRISGAMLKDNLVRDGVDLIFENTLGDNNLYLDVITGKVGVNTDAVTRELTVNDSIRTINLIVDNYFQIDDFVIDGVANTITYLPSDIITNSVINTDTISTTSGLKFNDTSISTTVSNASIELRPHGAGIVETTSSLDVSGNLHSTGDITFDGTITFGNQNNDSVTFNVEVNSDLIPNVSDTYNLGSNLSGLVLDGEYANSPAVTFVDAGSASTITFAGIVDGGTSDAQTKKWRELHTQFVNSLLLISPSISFPGITNIATRPGNTYYVADNGDNGNVGDHPSGPFASVKYALSQCISGDTVIIFPGEYQEIFPLTVPQGVTVKGTGIRSVKITPTPATNDKDAFLLNGETTISDLTVAGFYYNSSTGTGYAFRFAPNINVVSRSPYVQNITVLTEPNLPLIEAGRGALVDGSVAATTSNQATMLFHSVTFIVPGSIGLFMTNGVRVEWLNSFTYFASKGLYATNGSLGFASQATSFGAELRSIGSACVYGNVGAEGNGNAVIMYLIQHNFGYVGSGLIKTNDPTLTIQDNEVVPLNDAKIYYQSDDAQGNFRIGEAFFVDQATGFVTLNGIGQNVGGINEIILSNGPDIVKLLPTEVDANNIKFKDNTISSISGSINIDAINNILNLNQNVTVSANLSMTGNFNVEGTLAIGNQTIDQVQFDAEINSDLLPKVTEINSLGSNSLVWKNLSVVDVTLDNIKISGNKITTTVSNSDLELTAAGAGVVRLLSPTDIDNNFTVNGLTNLQSVTNTGNLSTVGDITQTGNKTQLGNLSLNGAFTLNNLTMNIGNISVVGNTISTTTSNSDLNFIASGTGLISVPTNDVVVTNDLFIGGQFSTPSLTVDNQVSADSLYNGNIQIQGNQVKTTLSNSDLDLAAVATGKIIIQDSLQVGQDLNVDGLTNFESTVINGTLTDNGLTTRIGNTTQTGNLNLVGDLTVTETAQFTEINITNNIVRTTTSNADLELVAGAGNIVEIIDDVQVTKNLTVADTLTVDDVTILNRLSMDRLTNGEILVDDNSIYTTTSNADLELAANGTGKILISDSVIISNNLTINGTANLSTTNINGDITVQNLSNALITQTGNRTQTGDFDLTGTLTQSNGIAQPVNLANIRLISNRITTVDSNSDLELRAAGTGNIVMATNPVIFGQNLLVNSTLAVENITVGRVNFNGISTGTILVDDNFITTTISNADLELRANGAGIISVPVNNFETYDLTVQGITNIKNTSVSGLLSVTGTINRTGNYTSTGAYNLTGDLTTNLEARFENFNFTDNRIFTTLSSSDVELRAAGTGVVRFNDFTDISLNLSVAGNMNINTLSVASLIQADSFYDDDIRIKDNFITTTLSNSNLNLKGDGTGGVLAEEILFRNNSIIANTTNADITLTPAAGKNVIINKSNALRLPNGTTAQRPVGVDGGLRYNITTARVEGWSAGATKPFNGVYSADKNTRVTASDTSNILNFVAANTATMEFTTTGLRSNGLRVNNNIDLDGRTFSSQSNGNINLTPNGTGTTLLDQTTVNSNQFLNLSNSLPMTINSTGFGYVKFNSTTALVIPSGDSDTRPSTPEVGDLRFNTQIQSPEIYNGVEYTTLAGDSVTATEAEIDDLSQLYGILLG